jgi:hypothetical protein
MEEFLPKDGDSKDFEVAGLSSVLVCDDKEGAGASASCSWGPGSSANFVSIFCSLSLNKEANLLFSDFE